MNRYKLIYIFTYAPIGVLCPLVGQYLKSIGFTGTEIGIVTAIGTLVSIFAATFWGKVYSKAYRGNLVIAVLSVFAACLSLASLFTQSFILFTIIYGAMYFFQGPVMGLSDAMTLEDDVDFAKIRMFGAVGYATSVFLGGRIADFFGLNKIFIVYTATFLIAAVLLATMRRPRRAEHINYTHLNDGKQIYENPSSSTINAEHGYSQLLKEKKVLQLILVGIFLFGTNVANNTYFGFLYTDGGGSVSGLGVMFFLMAGSEAPFMALAPVLSKKFGANRLIFMAMVVSCIRFSFYYTEPRWYFFMATFMLQGMVNGVLLVEYIKFISDIVNKRLIGIAVSAFYAISSNFGTIICNLLGGIFMDHFGSYGVYGLFASLNLIGLSLYLAFGFCRKSEIVC